jgi:hypothetical protein
MIKVYVIIVATLGVRPDPTAAITVEFRVRLFVRIDASTFVRKSVVVCIVVRVSRSMRRTKRREWCVGRFTAVYEDAR